MPRTTLFALLKRAAASAQDANTRNRDPAELIEAASATRPSRRRLLTASAGAVAAMSLAAACSSDEEAPPPSDASVAIVGAGLAGLVCAHRLKRAGVNATIYEASNRTGGRTYTARNMLPEGVTTELGGEFIDTNHETLLGLVDEFGFDLVDLAAEVKSSQEPATWFINGREVKIADLARRFQPLARRMAAAMRQARYSKTRFAQLDALSITEWLDEADDLDGVLRTALLESYRSEYGLEPEEQSVFNLLSLIDFEEPNLFKIYGASDERYRIRQGNDAVAGAIAKNLASQIRTGATLQAVAPGTTGRRLKLTVREDGSSRDAEYDHVVLALPFSTLRNADLSRLPLSKTKRRAIAELGYGTHTKLIGAFRGRPWQSVSNKTGACFTDNGLQYVWETSTGQRGNTGVLTNFLGGKAGVAAGTGDIEARFRRALPLLDQVFPGTAQQYVADSALRFAWTDNPYSKGSYACPKPGQWAFFDHMAERSGTLHFCGEHTSEDFQGFMEGAAETGARAAREVLEGLGLKSAVERRLVGATTA
jgi:monoamine oxidase